MKILVTGATGFIGRHVVRWLVNNNPDNKFEITATGTSDDKARKFDWYGKAEFIPCDYYSETKNWYEYFGKPDLLIHLSWKGLPNYMELFHMEENLPVEMNFLKSFAAAGKTKIAAVGTCYEFGAVEGRIAEDHPTNPVTVYAGAKDALRKYLEFMSVKYKFSWNWIRLFFLYGEGQNPKSLLPQLDAAIERGDAEFPMSGGEQLRDYLPVEKAAEYICRIALSDTDGPVNCCSGELISVRRLVEEHMAETGRSIKLKLGVYPYPVYEGMSFCGDTKKLKTIVKN